MTTTKAVNAEDVRNAQEELLDDLIKHQGVMAEVAVNIEGLKDGYDASFEGFLTSLSAARSAGVTFNRIEERMKAAPSSKNLQWKASAGTLSTMDAAAALLDLDGDLPTGWVLRPDIKLLPLGENEKSVLTLVREIIRPKDKVRETIDAHNEQRKKDGAPVVEVYGKNIVQKTISLANTKSEAIIALERNHQSILDNAKRFADMMRTKEEERKEAERKDLAARLAHAQNMTKSAEAIVSEVHFAVTERRDNSDLTDEELDNIRITVGSVLAQSRSLEQLAKKFFEKIKEWDNAPAASTPE